MTASHYYLIYDGQCPFCRQAVKRLAAMQLLTAAQAIPWEESLNERFRIQHTDIATRIQREIILLESLTTQYWGGVDAIITLARMHHRFGFWTWFFQLPWTGALAKAAYRLIAMNRYRLIKPCGEKCPLKPD